MDVPNIFQCGIATFVRIGGIEEIVHTLCIDRDLVGLVTSRCPAALRLPTMETMVAMVSLFVTTSMPAMESVCCELEISWASNRLPSWIAGVSLTYADPAFPQRIPIRIDSEAVETVRWSIGSPCDE